MRDPVGHVEVRTLLPGVEAMRATFDGVAFSPHRHDTYAVGYTETGVQAFRYRGAARQSLAGQSFVLHPDELHDGRPGDGGRFGYRTVYIDPAVVADAVGRVGLPFVADPVGADPALSRALLRLLGEWDRPVDSLGATCALGEVADALAGMGAGMGAGEVPRGAPERGVARARAFLAESTADRVEIAMLERVSGFSRWQLNRRFRAAYGVSPYRFHVLRRLAQARARLLAGCDPATAAQETGFADQAHFSRHFRKTYGISPGAWRRLNK